MNHKRSFETEIIGYLFINGCAFTLHRRYVKTGVKYYLTPVNTIVTTASEISKDLCLTLLQICSSSYEN